MVLLNEGLEELAEQFKALIDEGQWGTGTTTPSPTDTGLETPVPATLNTVTSANSGTSTTFTHTISSTTGNGNDLTEFELQFLNDDSLVRFVGGAITKSNSFEVKTIVNINFVRV